VRPAAAGTAVAWALPSHSRLPVLGDRAWSLPSRVASTTAPLATAGGPDGTPGTSCSHRTLRAMASLARPNAPLRISARAFSARMRTSASGESRACWSCFTAGAPISISASWACWRSV